MNSNKDKLYIKIVANNMIYNFIVENFLKKKSFRVPKCFFVSL